jgi:hypothetical protein
VSSVNHGFDPRVFIDAMPPGAVRQIHLAGHEDRGGYLIDTHDHPVCAAVWDLYAHTVGRFGQVPTMIERDDQIPTLDRLVAELDTARSLVQQTLAARQAGGMSTLAALQERFQKAVLLDDPTPGLFAAEGAALESGLAVYLQAYRARLTAALRDNYPVLQRALGDEAFDLLARAYLDEHPSHFRSIRWFGDSLAEFLAAAPEHLPHPALVDLARMDWAMRTAFDAADATLLGVGELVALPPEEWPQRHFKPVPSLQLLDLTWQGRTDLERPQRGCRSDQRRAACPGHMCC